MAGKIATRNAYGDALVALAEKYPQLVVLDADLAGATMTKGFAAAHPERFFDCGIAEANMTDIAAGMSTVGLKPFTNTFAIFAAGRAYEQVRNSIAYPGLNVTVVGSHGGISVGEDGATHQSIEDFALMRVIPGMLVCCPCDGHEMALAVEALINYNGPAYLRLERPVTPPAICWSRNHQPITDLLAAEGISARVIDMHTIKPLDEELVLKAAKETGAIVTSEEHSVIGGLGGAVSEFLSGTCPVPVVRHGVEDSFGRSGTWSAVLEYYGVTPEGIAAKAKQAIALKK